MTVLFADLVGFTPYSEGRDTEEVRNLLTRYFDEARQIIERFGGAVDKFIGDAVMAVWGAEAVSEDDAERGVRAALELVDAVRALGDELGISGLAARAGLTSGESSVGPGGNEKGLVVGDLVNIASRLQSVAQPDCVLVGQTTRQLSVAAIEYEDLGSLTVKGKTETVDAWQAVRVIAGRGGSRRTDGLTAPFVGRDHEIRMLKDLLHVTGREGRVRMISIIGDGGTGKSRLIDEFWQYIDGVVDDIYWHVGNSPAYGDGLTFWALGEMVRRRCGISETDDEHRTITKLRTALVEYVPDPDDRAWIEPRLGVLLGLSALPSSDRADLFGAWRAFFHHVSALGTTVMVFDDIHLADQGLLEFIDEFTTIATDHPVLVITLARPELLDRAPGWGSDRENSLAIRLGPLAPAAMTELISGMVPGVPEELVERLVHHAGGVPLYGVELVRMLYNRGAIAKDGDSYRLLGDVTRIDVPDSLHGVVGARIDQLDRAERELLQDASVLGQSFTLRALAALRDESEDKLSNRLDRFVGVSLLRIERDPRSPERGQYQFVQSLIREVAHARLTRSERRKRHLEAAEYFAGLGDPELAAAVASHYASALVVASDSEADEIGSRAAGALLLAAERAAGLHSHEQALALARQAVALTEDPVMLGRIQTLATESAHAIAHDAEAEEWARAAMASFADHGDADQVLTAATVLARIFADARRAASAVEVLAPLVERHPGETVAYARAAADLARSYMLAGELDKARLVADDVAWLAERLNLSAVVADLMITRGTILATGGRAREGMALLEAARAMAEASDSSRSLRRVLNNLAYFAVSDDFRKGTEYMVRGCEYAKKIGEPFWILNAKLDLFNDAIENGDWERAEATLLPGDVTMFSEHEVFRYERFNLTRRFWSKSVEGFEEKIRTLFEANADLASESPDAIEELGALKALGLLLSGRAEEAFPAAMDLDDPTPNLTDVDLALYAAMYLADADKLDAVATRLAEKVYRGDRVETLQMTIDGARHAVAGETARAAPMLAEAAARADMFCSRMQAAMIAGLGARILGTDSDTGADLARRAHAICEAADLRSIQRLIPDGLLADQPAAASS